MVAPGYVALKIRNRKTLYYVDWTNTRREYDLNNLTTKEIEDLKRLFNGKTTVLVPVKSRTVSILCKKIGRIDCKNCVSVKNARTAPKMLFTYLSRNNLPGGYYNHRRGVFLSILSTLNLHKLVRGWVSQETTLKIIKQELEKYWKKTDPEELYEGFVRIGLL